MTHICVSKLTIIRSDNCLSLSRRQAIIWTIAGILLTGPLGTNFSELRKIQSKMSSAKWRPFCLGLNVLISLMTSFPAYPAVGWRGSARVPALQGRRLPNDLWWSWSQAAHLPAPWYLQRSRISNHMPSTVWDEITYPFPNSNGCTVEVWEWISNFIPHFMSVVISFPGRDLS